ncbi:MAG: ABC-three component system protein [Flavobacterium sp.]|uniref:ABC-three component system protein n=1 Tax=Flavobacterium sp. TaxID=239 RepID=UPI0011D9FC26|nr:MAG: HNH endonuclease [Flavobacterium sp.]
MGSQARNYSQLTLKRLFALSGNKCAFPGCNIIFTNNETTENLSNICHIEDAEEGGRYNPDMNDSERASFDNLILLCPTHHKITDNLALFSVENLREMKRNHETNYLNERLTNNPSMLSNAINAISNLDLENDIETDSLKIFNLKEKIAYNQVKRNISIIDEYKIYHSKINSLYDELESQGSIKKEKLLNNIKLIYTKVKGNYILDSENIIESIRLNSDNIIDDIYNELFIQMEKSSFFNEDIMLGIRLIMVDAFIRCKILEEPI